MKKSFGYALVFVASMALSATYQSCGQSSVKANSSDTNDGLRVDITPIVDGDGDGEGNELEEVDQGGEPQCSTDSNSLNLNCGDNIFYLTASQATERVASVRVLLKSYYVLMETHIYEAPSVSIVSDLPSSYCTNSALPHCAHLNPFVCQGYGCFEGPQPVRCHWQKRMTNAQQNAAFAAVSELRYVNRVVDAENPFVDGCNDPSLSFYKENSTIDVSLAPRACVPNGDFYANNATGDGTRTIFTSEIVNVESFQEIDNTPEFCNNYSAYSFDTTRFNYRSMSGFVQPEDRYYYEAHYEALPVEDDPEGRMYGAIDLKWKIGDAPEKCVFDFPLNKPELDVLFPEGGLTYELFRPSVAIADVSSAEIIYEDPADGGATWRFFLDRGSAMLVNGGAVLQNGVNSQSDAIRAMIETVIVPSADPFSQTCPN